MEKSPKSTILIYVQRVEVQMKIGDLVIRKDPPAGLSWGRNSQLGPGFVIKKMMGGKNPVHPCVRVLYPRIGKFYDMAESLMKVVSKKKEECKEK
jgi:hypothetical protein